MTYHVIGIDPGLRTTGWAILVKDKQNRNIHHAASGIIQSTNYQDDAERLYHIFAQLKEVIKYFSIDFAAIENTYVNKNAKTSIRLAQTRTAAMLACREHDISIKEYQAKTIKKRISGNGNADKETIMQYICLHLDIKIEEISPKIVMDQSDAIAIALCCISEID
ncbi:Crossover junction endodeoxyribonuclease RuvC [Candidatus Fokinia solitaria]|uniref:Crossover junction endodeoxyribonuclease RuvC n=1 Tax=Candidatus Fokinia solitaria TaxID=1802984 RepID=A0A2U8BS43_9RICK|nr:crossover junction endodeoxyribonuclease RuvC [Candidatus Fokinia solitaria]AWD33100.1 Crossover junction endodeoxyribonuclease RuvC [Candidatus Fokinia solitaria]